MYHISLMNVLNSIVLINLLSMINVDQFGLLRMQSTLIMVWCIIHLLANFTARLSNEKATSARSVKCST